MKRLGKKVGKSRPVVLWFTGLSGSGKSTIAERICRNLKKCGLAVEYLDGDRIRKVFPGTGFTKQERDAHISRIGFTASVLEKHGVSVVASFVSPYEESRRFVRSICRRFVEVYISTPLKVCEGRDVKGLYARARRGEIANFTGISDPYEAPVSPEIEIDTSEMSVGRACEIIMNYLKRRKLI